MSAVGHKQTRRHLTRSASLLKADMRELASVCPFSATSGSEPHGILPAKHAFKSRLHRLKIEECSYLREEPGDETGLPDRTLRGGRWSQR
jgi:hypothetical protein